MGRASPVQLFLTRSTDITQGRIHGRFGLPPDFFEQLCKYRIALDERVTFDLGAEVAGRDTGEELLVIALNPVFCWVRCSVDRPPVGSHYAGVLEGKDLVVVCVREFMKQDVDGPVVVRFGKGSCSSILDALVLVRIEIHIDEPVAAGMILVDRCRPVRAAS